MAGGWCWFVVKEKYCWLADGWYWFGVEEKYCWLVGWQGSWIEWNIHAYAVNMYLLILEEKEGTRVTLPFQRISCCHVSQSFFFFTVIYLCCGYGPFCSLLCYCTVLAIEPSPCWIIMCDVIVSLPFCNAAIDLCSTKSATSKRDRQVIKDFLHRYQYWLEMVAALPRMTSVWTIFCTYVCSWCEL